MRQCTRHELASLTSGEIFIAFAMASEPEITDTATPAVSVLTRHAFLVKQVSFSPEKMRAMMRTLYFSISYHAMMIIDDDVAERLSRGA